MREATVANPPSEDQPMRSWIEQTYGVTFTSFAEFDGEREVFACVTTQGHVLVADSLGLLLGELANGSNVVQLPMAA